MIGRSRERHRLDELISAAGRGHGGALVLRGEAGIGKSTLLEYAVRGAPGFRTIELSGSEFEKELPYAGLHQLCLPMLGHLDELPDRHRDALRVAFGMAEGAPEPFHIGLAALGLMTAAARTQPLLCLIDDAQWLDAASSAVLPFLARRLVADPIAMLVAVRPGPGAGVPAGLPVLTVGGLTDEQAKALLTARSPFPLDDQVRDRLVAEADGNPLALLELPRAGGFEPPGAAPVPDRIEHGFRARLAGLSAPARLLLTVASADPTGDSGLLWAAARHLDLDLGIAGAEASATGLADFGPRTRFCHPLARSAVYRAAPAGQRRAAHGALAAVTDPVMAPDRRAWHRAQAAAGPDDDLAADLERCASRAQSRGGVAAAAAFLERAAALSLNIEHRAERTLAAAEAHFEAGATDVAVKLLQTVPLNEVQHARADLVLGRVAFVRPNDGSGPVLMAQAARRLSATHPDQARDCYLEALEMSLVVGRGGGVLREVLAAAPVSSEPDLLTGLRTLVTDGSHAATPMLRTALHQGGDPLWEQRPALAAMVAVELWDLETHATIAAWLVKAGRESGSPRLLQLGLGQTAVDAVVSGDLGRAIAAAAEEAAVADASGAPPLIYHRLHLAAHRGHDAEFARLATPQVTNLHATAATLYNGLADYPAALAAARRATENNLFLTGAVLPELVEAAVRTHDHAAATEALASLTEHAEAAGAAAGRGIAAYARGLVTREEKHYQEAVELLAEGRLATYLGRAHLLYGEWLRREGRRRDGRRQLQTAYDLLSRAGADGFARRAANELRATGERVQPRTQSPHEQLSMQETAVARLVAGGATSLEIAGKLFISKRTVDAHLRSIFRKLGLTSRRQLRDHPGLHE